VYSKRAHLMSKYNQRRLFEDSNSCSIFLYALSQLTICLIFLLLLHLLLFNSILLYSLNSLTRGAITMTLSGSFDTYLLLLCFLWAIMIVIASSFKYTVTKEKKCWLCNLLWGKLVFLLKKNALLELDLKPCTFHDLV